MVFEVFFVAAVVVVAAVIVVAAVVVIIVAVVVVAAVVIVGAVVVVVVAVVALVKIKVIDVSGIRVVFLNHGWKFTFKMSFIMLDYTSEDASIAATNPFVIIIVVVVVINETLYKGGNESFDRNQVYGATHAVAGLGD